MARSAHDLRSSRPQIKAMRSLRADPNAIRGDCYEERVSIPKPIVPLLRKDRGSKQADTSARE
jgi:hypothetical protein